MTSTRSGRCCVAAFVASLLAFPVQAAPTLIAQASASEDATTPSPARPQGQPGTPPAPPPAAYPPGTYPPPGAYPYPYQPYGPPPPYFVQPYYASPPKPLDMRAPVLDYDPDQPIPKGYRLESHARKGMVISGSIVLGVSWVISALIAGSTNESSTTYSSSSSYYYSDSNGVPFNSGLLYIPVVGPWLALGSVHDRRDCSTSSYSYDYSCEDENSSLGAWKFLLVTDGVAQVVGAGLVVLGLSLRSRQLVLTDNVQATILPARIGSTGHGLAMVGSFSGL